MRWPTVLLAVGALAWPALTAADSLPFPTDRPVSNSRTMTAIAAAQQLLPDGACMPKFFIAALPPDKLGYAMTDPAVCVAWIPPRVALGHGIYAGWQGRILACTILEHEALHELGYTNPVGYVWKDGTVDHTHSPDKRSIMYPFTLDETASWPCFARFAPHGAIRAWHTDYGGLRWSTFP